MISSNKSKNQTMSSDKRNWKTVVVDFGDQNIIKYELDMKERLKERMKRAKKRSLKKNRSFTKEDPKEMTPKFTFVSNVIYSEAPSSNTDSFVSIDEFMNIDELSFLSSDDEQNNNFFF